MINHNIPFEDIVRQTCLYQIILTLYSIGYFRSLHHLPFLDKVEKIQEKFK